jgi:NAD(P) transhydrogenase
VITVLNAYSGFALVAEGLMLNNPLLTSVGSLIGVSGSILSYIMCVAMNRSLTNVLFGGLAAPQQAQKKIEGEVTRATVEETVDSLAGAESVIIVSPNVLSKYIHSQWVGRWVWYGCCKGTVRTRRDNAHAAR